MNASRVKLSPHQHVAEKPATGDAPPLSVTGICKSYGPVRALFPTSFSLAPGEIHALVGENGSGKSTVVGILSGVVRPDAGVVAFAGSGSSAQTPWGSQRAGTLTVFQDGSLLGDLTVAQNLYLGTPRELRPSYGRIDSWSRDSLRSFGLERIAPNQLTDSLSPGDRQLLDVVRAVMARPKVLLLDEATSALDAAGVDVALQLMRKVAADGTAVLFVTHRLSEVFRVAQRISVLRDGEWQGTYERSDVDAQALVELMAGTSVNVEFPQRARQEELAQPSLTAVGLSGPAFGPIDLEVRGGEIVGVAGADNNGQLPLLRALTATDFTTGHLRAGNTPLRSLNDAVRAGVAYLSSDRRSESLYPSLPIRENLVAGVLRRLSTAGYIPSGRERGEARRTVDRFGIRLGSVEDAPTSLSGGNQQKVALGRVLATESRIILIDEPTQGVDVRSRIDIYHLLRSAARAGAAVVVVSSDAAELAGLCDRVVVLSRGLAVAELSGTDATEEGIINAFTGAEHAGRPVDPARAETTTDGGRLRRRRDFLRLHQNGLRLIALVAMLAVIAAYAQAQNDTFLTRPSVYNVLLLALPLAVVAGAEFLVMFAGGIDVSVGANMGVTVATLSFLVQTSTAGMGILVSVLAGIGVGITVGVLNSLLVERIRISPVIATIATLGVLQGVGLLLRPQAAGVISPALSDAMTSQVGPIPIVLIIVAVLFVLADLGLSRSGRGLRLRAIGLNPLFAYRLGENAPRTRQFAYVGCAILAAFAGALLAAQVGTGDSTVGNQYTLLAIAAPILGGASLLGGRGTFIGCLVGAVFIAIAEALPTVLALSDGTSFLVAGVLTLLALFLYSPGTWQVLGRTARAVFRRARPAPTAPLAGSHVAGT